MLIEKFKVEDWFNKYEKGAKFDLADTCVESLSLNELQEITKFDFSEIEDVKLNYGNIHGSDRLKNAIISLYKNQSKENITVTHGAIGANYLVISALVNAGDKVVSVVPTYQQHYSIPKAFGADVELFYLNEENNWLPNLEELEKIVGNDTKLICLNNPNNPTGALIPDDMMNSIVDIAKKSDAYILCDEVYRGLNHNKNNFGVSVSDIYEKGISTSSVSKVFSLAGLRLGWIIAREDIINIINLQREYSIISLGILDDFFASVAIENKDKIINRNQSKILEGKDILLNWANNNSMIRLISPNAGTTAFVGYNLNIDSYTLCKKLLDDTGVLLLPGKAMELDGYLRIGYGNNPENLKKALEIFSDWLKINF